MLDSPVVETAVGLLVTFYALAMLCAGVVELIATWVKKRSKYLLRGLRDLVEGGAYPGGLRPLDPRSWQKESRIEGITYQTALNAGLTAQPAGADASATPLEASADQTSQPSPATPVNGPTGVTLASVMGHALVLPYKQTSATGRATRNPSYLPSAVFSRTIVDLLTDDTADPVLSMQGIRQALVAPNLSLPLQRALSGLAKSAGEDVQAFLTAVEGWFDTQMDRITGSYKRWAKRWVVVIATTVVLAGGLDSIAIARALYADEAVRDTVSQTLPAKICPAKTDAATCSQNAKEFFQGSGLPIGWSAPNPADGDWGIPLKIVGLLLSIGAAGVGAPFWYKVLDRVGALRNAGNRPPSSTG